MNISRTSKIVSVQTKAASLQKACKWMPAENFFANMIGHMAMVYGPEFAAQIVTVFEMASQDHEEMMDSTASDPKAASAAFREGVKRWADRRAKRC